MDARILSTSEQTDERRQESKALEGRSQVLTSRMKGGLGFIACLNTRLITTLAQTSHNVLQRASTHSAGTLLSRLHRSSPSSSSPDSPDTTSDHTGGSSQTHRLVQYGVQVTNINCGTGQTLFRASELCGPEGVT